MSALCIISDIGHRCVDVMRRLIAKYPDGYEGWAKARGEEPLTSEFLTVQGKRERLKQAG